MDSRAPFLIIGPLTPQVLELSSSSSGSHSASGAETGDATLSPPQAPRKAVAGGPGHVVPGRRRRANSAPSSILDSPTPTETAHGPGIRALIRTPPSSPPSSPAPPPSPAPSHEHVDWLEYGAPMSDFGGAPTDDGAGSTWSQGGDEGEGSAANLLSCKTVQDNPAILINESNTVRRIVLREQLIADLLQRPAEPAIDVSAPSQSGVRTPPCKPFRYGSPPSTPGKPNVRAESESPPAWRTDGVRRSLIGQLNVTFGKSKSAPSRLSATATRSRALELVQEAELFPLVPPEKAPTSAKAAERSPKCDSCGRDVSRSKTTEIIPCGDILCSSCFSSSISAVSVTYGPAKCAACLTEVTSFRSRWPSRPASPNGSPIILAARSYHRSAVEGQHTKVEQATVVLRIDNVAWDVTPEVVTAFLPLDVLPQSHPQPIHILLDRFDGRTKDYMYVEVASLAASQQVRRTLQNRHMPGGVFSNGKIRPVTITQVTHAELLRELRPRSAFELHSLLALCQAAVCTPPASIRRPGQANTAASRPSVPNGVAHFVKSRHGPFYALMSVMSKLGGHGSPAYWDLFHMASGAIAALAQCIDRSPRHGEPEDAESPASQDAIVLSKLSELFKTCFGDILHRTTWDSPISGRPRHHSASVDTIA